MFKTKVCVLVTGVVVVLSAAVPVAQATTLQLQLVFHALVETSIETEADWDSRHEGSQTYNPSVSHFHEKGQYRAGATRTRPMLSGLYDTLTEPGFQEMQVSAGGYMEGYSQSGGTEYLDNRASGSARASLDVDHFPEGVPPNLIHIASSADVDVSVNHPTYTPSDSSYVAAGGRNEISDRTGGFASLRVEPNAAEGYPVGTPVEIRLTGSYSRNSGTSVYIWLDGWEYSSWPEYSGVINHTTQVLVGQSYNFYFQHMGGIAHMASEGPTDSLTSTCSLDITVVPEPATLSLLTLGGLAMVRRGRK